MVRFFSVHRTPAEGTHLHLAWTSYRRTLADAFKEMKARENAHAARPLFCDFGPDDSDLRQLDHLGY